MRTNTATPVRTNVAQAALDAVQALEALERRLRPGRQIRDGPQALVDIEGLGLEGGDEDLLVALVCVAVRAVRQRAPLVRHEVAALRDDGCMSGDESLFGRVRSARATDMSTCI